MALLSWFDEKVTEPKAPPLSGISLKYILDTHHLLKKKLLDKLGGASQEPLDVAILWT